MRSTAAMRPSIIAASSRHLSATRPASLPHLHRSLLPSSSPLPLSLFPRRSFAAIPTPVDRSLCPDGVYRRPPVPQPRAPLSEDDELVWHDGQAPEPVLDRYAHIIAPRRSLAQLVAAIVVVFGGVYAIVQYVDTAAWQPTQPQQMPYEQLAVEYGRQAAAQHTATD